LHNSVASFGFRFSADLEGSLLMPIPLNMGLASIRFYEPKDAAFLGAVFFDAVRTGGLRDYSQSQVEAWAPAMPDPARFEARAKDGRLMLVAVNEVDEPIAYGDLEPNGHVDHLYFVRK